MEPEAVGAIEGRSHALAEYHRRDLPARQRDVLILEYFGFELDEIAKLLGNTKATVKNQLHAARTTVVPPSLPSTRANATFWTSVHRSCCMATAFAMLEC